MEEFLANPHSWVGVGITIFLLILVWKKVPKAIAGMLDARAALISKQLNDARQLREEASALLAQYREKQAKAESEAASIVAQARTEAARYAAEAKVALDAQIERRAKQAQDKIAQAEAQAVAEVRALAADAAVTAAEKLIAERLTETRSGELITSALKEIPAKLN